MKKLISGIFELFSESKYERVKVSGIYSDGNFDYYVNLNAEKEDKSMPWKSEEISIYSKKIGGIRNRTDIILLDLPKKLEITDEISEQLRFVFLKQLSNELKYLRDSRSDNDSNNKIYLSLEKDRNNQEVIMREYVEKYSLSKDQRADLHMFFSPDRVVRGLTKEDILNCIKHRSDREKQASFYSFYMKPPSLHSDLLKDSDVNIPRTKELGKAIQQVLFDIEKKSISEN